MGTNKDKINIPINIGILLAFEMFEKKTFVLLTFKMQLNNIYIYQIPTSIELYKKIIINPASP